MSNELADLSVLNHTAAASSPPSLTYIQNGPLIWTINTHYRAKALEVIKHRSVVRKKRKPLEEMMWRMAKGTVFSKAGVTGAAVSAVSLTLFPPRAGLNDREVTSWTLSLICARSLLHRLVKRFFRPLVFSLLTLCLFPFSHPASSTAPKPSINTQMHCGTPSDFTSYEAQDLEKMLQIESLKTHSFHPHCFCYACVRRVSQEFRAHHVSPGGLSLPLGAWFTPGDFKPAHLPLSEIPVVKVFVDMDTRFI